MQERRGGEGRERWVGKRGGIDGRKKMEEKEDKGSALIEVVEERGEGWEVQRREYDKKSRVESKNEGRVWRVWREERK
jgi:hypothetical protein